jgi:hypothetical protein
MCRQRRDVVEAGVEVKSGGDDDFPRKISLDSSTLDRSILRL